MWHWLALFFGVYNGDGNNAGYLFWSGTGSDLAYLGMAAAFLRGHNCEVHRCWRFGRHPTAAGQKVCRRHHPDGHLTAESVRQAHHLYLGSKPGRG